MRFAIGPIAALLVVSACASSGGTAGGCTPMPGDSVYVAATPAYRDCAVDRKARLLTPNVPIDYRAPTQMRSATAQCHNADVEFVVDAMGKPEMHTARVLRATPPEFGEALLATVPQLRYSPAEKAGTAVRQIVRHHRGVAMVLVVARAGSPPPTMPPRPTC